MGVCPGASKLAPESDLTNCGTKLRPEETEVLRLLQARLKAERKRRKPLPVLLKESSCNAQEKETQGVSPDKGSVPHNRISPVSGR